MTTDTTMVTMSEKPVEMARPDPNEMVAYATQIADALNGVIEGQGLFTIINGKKHVRAEGWETVISLDMAVPIIEWVRPIVENGETIAYEARAVIKKNGLTVAAGEMECGMDEFPTRGQQGRGKHRAAKSAAQTWAVAKAARTKYAWIVALAGYSGTPAHEMQSSDAVEPRQESRGVAPAQSNGQHFCAEHGTDFFKRGRMRGYAHPVADTGKWHNEEDASEPAQGPRTATQMPEQPDGPEQRAHMASIQIEEKQEDLFESESPTPGVTAFWMWIDRTLLPELPASDRRTWVQERLGGMSLPAYLSEEGHDMATATRLCEAAAE
jgi:hypothetical protein